MAREQSNKLLGVPTYNRQAYEQAAVHYDKDGKLSISPLRAKMSNGGSVRRPSTPPEDQPLSPREFSTSTRWTTGTTSASTGAAMRRGW